ncbi:MAG: DUF4398 domain-containing protein [Casimicrobiaceae bacterium]
MLRNSAKSVLALAMLAAAGCASVPERDVALEDARMSVNAARSNSQIATYAPAELDKAVATMRQADDLAASGGRIGDVDQLAMLASQRAGLAQEAARARSEEAALMVQRRANDAQLTANMSRRQAEAAQIQATDAQRQAEDAQRVATSMQPRADVYAAPAYDYRRRQNERLYEANVSYVRAVVGPPQRRCWMDREQVANRGPAGINVPGAIIGGAIGGIIGHQIGGGRGQDFATGIGIVGGAAVGANVGRGSDGGVYAQNVPRCEVVPASASLDYWDVTYNFAGYEHRVQMTTAPGTTILVNAEGEPRV